MSLRYRLNKERFKGKKLPPKIRTNEDHVSEDQRGDLTSSDMEFEAVRRFKDAVKKPIEESEFSRRGLFSHLNRLKEYSDESERLEAEKNPTKKKKRKKKNKAKVEEGIETGVAEAAADSGAEEGVADAIAEPASDTAVEEVPKPKKGFFRRVKEYFYPSLEFEEAKPKSKPKPKAAPKPAIAVEGESADGAAIPAGAEDTTARSAELEAHDASTEVQQEDEERDPDDKEMDRRYMLRQSVHFFAKPTVDNIQGKIDKVNTAFDRITKRPPLLRPPGAISEREFLNACTRCSDCVNACPKDAILKVPKKMGFLIMDTPYIDPAKVPCVMCDGLPCIAACEEGALLPVPGGPRDVEMGYAILDKKKCQAYGDGFCQQCLIDCPIPGAITQDRENRPTIHKDVCTGCGVCVRSCGTVNIPVAIKVKPQMVIEYQQRKKEREKQKAELEARRQQLQAEQARQETATATEEPPEEGGEDSTTPDGTRSEEP
ncbi:MULTISPECIES: 4Fe-4S dicluster domain-containing protein [unclassified Nitrospina]|uniref:4Fe-4S dicluster domain-containing protein n=1 Tax=unclassified Nitrospina TaxID=2638683 RepID=UPI003F9D392E